MAPDMFDNFSVNEDKIDKLSKPTTTEREVAIFGVLKRAQQALSVSEIRNLINQYYNDDVSIQAYHKTINRLEVIGQLECTEEHPTKGKLYSIAPYMHAANPVTLDDIYEWTSLSPTEQIAKATDAQECLEDMKETILKKTAVALTKECPRTLFYNMISHLFEALKADLSMFREEELRDKKLKERIERQYKELHKILYRHLSIPPKIVDISNVKEIMKGDFKYLDGTDRKIQIDKDSLERILSYRIFGETFLYKVNLNIAKQSEARDRLTVAGSDGSTHASSLHLRTAQEFLDDPNVIVRFNNSMAYVHLPDDFKKKIPYPFHSIPITRSAMDDPANRGMIIARLMFPDIEDDSVYEHLSRCATDVVQWRVDHEVFSGTARSISAGKIYQTRIGAILPPPVVYIRNGTVTLQEREFGHYSRDDEYGEFVREGQRKAQEILRRLTSEDNRQVFAGAVKSTQLRIFTKLISWYISCGSKLAAGANGSPIDPEWEKKCSAAISDNQLMTSMLSILVNPEDAKQGEYWVSCAVVRQFHSTTEFFAANVQDKSEWESFFREKKEQDRETANKLNQICYWDTPDAEDDAFIYLCKNADYGMFYVGHTYGSPLPTLPRYEFFDSIRKYDTSEGAVQRVNQNIDRILNALHLTKFHIDSDHNIFTGKKVTKIVPYVVYRAHETGKEVGRFLESELRSAVISVLARFGKQRGIRPTDVDLIPISIQKFIRPMIDSFRKDEDTENR